MELSEELKDEIIQAFQDALAVICYGKITFSICPDMKYLQYTIEDTKRINIKK